MKSFPSSLNRGNKNIIMNHASKSLLDTIISSIKDSFTNAWKSGIQSIKFGANHTGAPVDTEGLPFDDFIDKKALLSGLDFTKFRDYKGQKILRGSTLIPMDDVENTRPTIENPYNFDSNAIAIMNKYRGETIKKVTNASNVETKDGNYFGSASDVKRSLFNPYNGVHVIGITENIPLLYDQTEPEGDPQRERNISDCSISRLVSESAKKHSILGQARYKYADFAFCKYLGMPNNRLITLRKFSIPVGDYIFRAASAEIEEVSKDGKPNKKDNVFTMPGDIGRMCCYFDTDDNKLEDILKYSFSASWQNMDAEIEQKNSQENDHATPLGKIINTLNPSMNSMIASGFEGSNNSLIGRAASSFFGWMGKGIGVNAEQGRAQYYDKEILTNYDKHRIYKPRNTIQSMHKYEGKLEFKHEFTLVFSYKLRGYQNINPKSAMLDLLANVFATTYSRGAFWGGRQEIIGAQPNKSGWQKAMALVDKAGDDVIGGLIGCLKDGSFDGAGLLGNIANILGGRFKKLASMFTIDNIKKAAEQLGQGTANLLQKSNMLDAGVGAFKNQLGRPEIYAFQSLLDGSNTGLWHVTIGNPFNPIASIGNLIISDTQIQQFGPLGIDDFPTELKVSVTLKHARPRDSVAMERMYTKGVSAIYIPLTATKERTKVFREDVKEEIGSLDYFGEFAPERIKRNADELG